MQREQNATKCDGEGPRLSLTSLVFRFRSIELQNELEKFRREYEQKFGETDLTKRYTSTLPTDQQEWLLAHEPRRYWQGLPPFVQAYLTMRMQQARKTGTLDNMPEALLQLYISEIMGKNGRTR